MLLLYETSHLFGFMFSFFYKLFKCFTGPWNKVLHLQSTWISFWKTECVLLMTCVTCVIQMVICQCTRGVQKVHRPTQLATRYAHHILSLFDIFSCNWNALGPAFLQSSHSVVEELFVFYGIPFSYTKLAYFSYRVHYYSFLQCRRRLRSSSRNKEGTHNFWRCLSRNVGALAVPRQPINSGAATVQMKKVPVVFLTITFTNMHGSSWFLMCNFASKY